MSCQLVKVVHGQHQLLQGRWLHTTEQIVQRLFMPLGQPDVAQNSLQVTHTSRVVVKFNPMQERQSAGTIFCIYTTVAETLVGISNDSLEH